MTRRGLVRRVKVFRKYLSKYETEGRNPEAQRKLKEERKDSRLHGVIEPVWQRLRTALRPIFDKTEKINKRI